jgi:hypothetical protein
MAVTTVTSCRDSGHSSIVKPRFLTWRRRKVFLDLLTHRRDREEITSMKNVKSKMSKTLGQTKILLGTILILLGLFVFASPAPSLIERVSSSFASEVNVIHVPRDYSTIQAGVDAASAGDIIQVAAGVYNENVVIATSALRLHGSSGAVIDGFGLTGSGIHVRGTAALRVLWIRQPASTL